MKSSSRQRENRGFRYNSTRFARTGIDLYWCLAMFVVGARAAAAAAAAALPPPFYLLCDEKINKCILRDPPVPHTVGNFQLESMFEDVPDEDEDQDGVFQRASGPPLATPSPRQASVQAPAASAGGSAAGVGLDSGLSALPISTSPPPEVEAAEGKKLAESKERLVALAKVRTRGKGPAPCSF